MVVNMKEDVILMIARSTQIEKETAVFKTYKQIKDNHHWRDIYFHARCDRHKIAVIQKILKKCQIFDASIQEKQLVLD